MTSLDFKALLKKERAKLQEREQSKKEDPFKGITNAAHVNHLTLTPRLRLDLSNFKVMGPVEGIHYVPEWLSEEDAQQLLKAIDQVGGLFKPQKKCELFVCGCLLVV